VIIIKILKSLFLTVATIAFTLSALINAASACGYAHYQPKLPKSLQK